jgi:methionyl-tRNA formyltransferase
MENRVTLHRCAICAYRPWNIEAFKDFIVFSEPEHLREKLHLYNPEWVFFLDWSWIIPKDIINKYKCVCFHESDLPNFRGGSPIQNQISQGVKKTKLTAFLMDEGLDTGDILLQEDLDLSGHIKDIFDRVVPLTRKMIEKIVKGEYEQRKQEGKGSYYARRTPADSELDVFKFKDASLEKIYDTIRMLEDPYPNAFMVLGDRKVTFKSAEMEGNKIKALIEIE